MDFLKIQKEEIKKLLILIFLLLVLAAVFVLQKPDNKISAGEKQNENKPRQEEIADLTLDEILKQNAIEEAKRIEAQKYMPSDKAEIIKQAKQNSGKIDPFTQTTIASAGNDNLNFPPSRNLNFNNKNFPLMPPPNFDTFPVSDRQNVSLPPANFDEGVKLKGFIGEKAILNINGSTKALQKGESFGLIKVLEVNIANRTVKISDDGKIVTKQIEKIDTSDVISKNI